MSFTIRTFILILALYVCNGAASKETEFVTKAIAQNRVVVFSKTNCPNCNTVKQQLEYLVTKKGFKTIEMDQLANGKQIQDALELLTAIPTVPYVFVNGKFIAGETDLKDMHQSGQLQKELYNKRNKK
ncbi:glutaredoxin-like [Contarinia nasturtii]|uniref:glutaredoxin-like n=1 Tax=Contarinia nasturtii TaxID=265458 RepID=UPI0012D41F89|nr:glutaredoxin-like [Contarinia nasturtii]